MMSTFDQPQSSVTALPEECLEVYSSGMDKEAKQFLQELTAVLRDRSVQSAVTPSSPSGRSVVGGAEALNNLQNSVRDHGNDLKWHRNIGWGIAGIFAAVFTGLLTWYLPKEFNQQLSQTKTEFSLELSRQLGPLTNQVASLTGALEVLKPNAAKTIPKLLEQNLQQNDNPRLAMETIAALADSATKARLLASESEVRSVGRQLTERDNIQAPTQQWDAIVKLAVFHSTLTIPPTPYPFPIEKPALPQIYIRPWGVDATVEMWGRTDPDKGAWFGELSKYDVLLSEQKTIGSTPQWMIVRYGKDAGIHLDGSIIRHTIIENATIVYKGGPFRLEDAYFINCRFVLDRGVTQRKLMFSLFSNLGVSVDVV